MNQIRWLPARRQLSSLQSRLILAPKLLANDKRHLWNGESATRVTSTLKGNPPKPRGRPLREKYLRATDEQSLGSNDKSSSDGKQRKISTTALEADVHRLLHVYQAKLFGEVGSEIEDRGTCDASAILEQAELLHGKCLSDAEKIKFQCMEDSDRDFRDLCNMIQKFIFVSMSRGQPRVAENLLRTLVVLRVDRDSLLQQMDLQEDEPAKSSELGSTWMGWIRNVFNPSTEDEVKKRIKFKETSIMNRIPDTYIGRTRKEVMSACFHAVAIDETNYAVLLDRAVRLTSLMEIGKETPLSLNELSHVIIACGAIGTLSMATKAEEIWRNNRQAQTPELLYCVLLAYANAAKSDLRRSKRREASKRAEQLVLGQPANSWPDHASKCAAFSIVLQALCCSEDAPFPALCGRAETLVIHCIGRRSFNRIKSPQAEEHSGSILSRFDLELLHHLVTIYAGQEDLRLFEEAKQCLHSMEMHSSRQRASKAVTHAARTNKEYHEVAVEHILQSLSRYDKLVSHWKKDENSANALGVSFPSIDTYRSMLNCIWQLCHSKTTDVERFEMAKYATGLLDNMETKSITPGLEMYNQLLNIWLQVRSIESGEYADKILARMQLREICDRDFQVSSESYKQVLRCWRTSSQLGHPLAAERGSMLLRFMEAQSGILGRLSHPDMESPRANFMAAYNEKVAPDIEAYDLVLGICTTATDSLPFALEAHARMCRTEIQPTAATYADLLLCLAQQMPQDSPRRKELATEILKQASLAGKLDSTVWKVVEGFDKSLYSEFQNDRS